MNTPYLLLFISVLNLTQQIFLTGLNLTVFILLFLCYLCLWILKGRDEPLTFKSVNKVQCSYRLACKPKITEVSTKYKKLFSTNKICTHMVFFFVNSSYISTNQYNFSFSSLILIQSFLVFSCCWSERRSL